MTARKTILVIEDDAAIRTGVVEALRCHGHSVLEAADGKSGMTAALSASCDLILLDIVLPGRDGLDILRAVRQERPTLPVILTTARGAEQERIEGLRLGGDDYVVKPFSVRELMARIEAVLRRSPERPHELRTIDLDGGCVDLDRFEVRYRDGERFELSQREVELLRYLAGHAGRTISRDELLTRVWGIDPRGIETRTIDMHVARLREKLRDQSGENRILRTVRGAGYVFQSPEVAT